MWIVSGNGLLSSGQRSKSRDGRKSGELWGTMRLFRAAVIAVFTAAAVLLAPGVASASSGFGPLDCERSCPDECERIWFWWIPMPCMSR